MFSLGPATRIFLGLDAVDMRKGFDGLFGLVRDKLGEDPLSGHLFLFINKPRTRVKALFWDGSGLWLCAKRLERGRFQWPTPKPDTLKVTMRGEQLAMLVNGLDLSKTQSQPGWYRREPGTKDT